MKIKLSVLLVCSLVCSLSAQSADVERQWLTTLERISSGVVSIRVDSTRAFDTGWNLSSQATGFVVDAEHGIILTNRHVVTPGPVVAEAVFLNGEEVRLTPIYRDPVHDFGFFSYDPQQLNYIKPTELSLVPGEARVGSEIRVVGNDAGEQLSILAGTIARLDRQAPDYGRGKYGDFNTFYIQAASGTSGGSSGSPVINIEGDVVALNAGAANSAASSFFLPLDRVARVLQLLQAGQPVTRGTLQTIFNLKAYDELRRLGLTATVEREVRSANAKQTGMLVVESVIAESPADGKLKPGDILLRINGELITKFVPLEALLDANIGQSITVQLMRGGQTLDQKIVVQDLHAITPDSYLEFGDAIVNNLSYQQARHYNLPIRGIYVANPGYVFSRAAIPRGAVITEVNGDTIDSIDDLQRVLAGLADGDRATTRFITLEDSITSVVRSVEMDRRWFPAHRCRRNDVTGLWPCTDLEAGPPAKAPKAGSTSFSSNSDPRVRRLAPSLVVVNFDLPYTISGIADQHYYGTGVIVDAKKGLVLVDRNTVPVAMGDVSITFAGSLEVKGKVEFVHPLHNLAIVSYDPALIGDTPVRNVEFNLEPLLPGDDTWVVGLKYDHRLVHQAAIVASVDPVVLPLSNTLRFRDANLEAISLVTAPEVDGVLADQKGRVQALWSSFSYQNGGGPGQINSGVPAELIKEFVDIVRTVKPIYSLEAEFDYAPLFAARKRGMDEEWLRRLEQHNEDKRSVLSISRIVGGSPAEELLRNGDMLLAVDGQVVTSFRELERAVQKPTVKVTVWRDSEALQLTVDTVSLTGRSIERAVVWAGALLQDPHRAIAAQRGIKPDGVYVAFYNYGSPATRYGLWAGRRISEVDGIPVHDLQSFVDAVKGKADQTSVRLATLAWNGAKEVITLKLDNQYWPAYEIVLTADGWQRLDID